MPAELPARFRAFDTICSATQERQDAVIALLEEQPIDQGREIFRYDTFGDEDFWGGQLQLHKAIEGAELGGVGPGVSPKTALTAAGLKVDVNALPKNLQAQLKQGKVDLDSPARS